MWLTVSSGKGGVAKTTLAVTLAAWLAKQGKRVAFIDADPSQSGARWLERIDSSIPRVGVADSADARGAVLDAARQAHELGAEVYVADSPPSAVEAIRTLAGLSDLVVIPTGASVEELYLAATTAKMVRQEEEARRGDDPIRRLIVLTRLRARTKSAQEALGLVDDLGAPMASSFLTLREAWPTAQGEGVSIFDLGARGTDAAREAEAVCSEILSKVGEEAAHGEA